MTDWYKWMYKLKWERQLILPYVLVNSYCHDQVQYKLQVLSRTIISHTYEEDTSPYWSNKTFLFFDNTNKTYVSVLKSFITVSLVIRIG